LLLFTLVLLLLLFAYLDRGAEPAAEAVEDAEAVVQPERLFVFTEEIHQLEAVGLELETVTMETEERCGGGLGRRQRTRSDRKYS